MRILGLLSYYLCTAAFFLASFGLNIVCLALLAFPFRARLRTAFRATLGALFRALLWGVKWMGVIRVEFEGLHKRPGAEPRVWVMNHPTIMDCVYLLSRIPNSTPIYKGAIASNPFYGCIARLADFLPNAVGPDMIRAAVERIQRGEDVLIFPEGTRSTEMQVDRFKGGFALIALRARSPIELLWIDNPSDFLTREVSPWSFPRLPARVRIRSLGVVRPEVGENATSLRNRVAEQYRKHMSGAANAS